MRKYEKRFWSRVDKSGSCWLWTAALHSAGYGVLRINCSHEKPKGTLVYAHRFAYELLRGPISDGLTLDHLCRVRRCCNPDHLEPVSAVVNTLRGISPYAKNARKTHCDSGHELSGENLYLRPDGGGRQCLLCKHEYWNRWYAKKKKSQDVEAVSLAAV